MSSDKGPSLRLYALAILAMAATLSRDAAASTCEASALEGGTVSSQPVDGTIAIVDMARRAVVDGSSEREAIIEQARAAMGSVQPGSRPDDLRARIHFGRTLDLLAVAARKEGKGDRAIALENEAVELWRRAVDRQQSAISTPWISYAYGYEAEVLARQGRRKEALARGELAVLAAASQQDLDALARWQSDRGTILRDEERRIDAIRAYRSAHASLESLRPGLDAPTFLDRAKRTHRPLADLLLLASSDDPATEQERLREAQAVLEDLKVAELRDYFDDPCLVESRKTQPQTIPGAVVLYPVILDDRVELLVGEGGRLHRRSSVARPDVLLEEARLFQLRVRDPTSNRYRSSGRKLYQWLIHPIEDLLGDGSETLVFVPTGGLLPIPIAALWNEHAKSHLIDQIAVAVTPGLQLTDPRPIDRRRTRTLIAGLTTGVEGFVDLPHVRAEMDAVESSFPGARIEGESFSLDGFEKVFATEPFGIVHIATHGFFDGDPTKSFLVTQSGRISMERLAEMVRSTRFRAERPLELLTLSACDTAAGDDRAILGLAGIAVRSGARSALASLWSVNDEATTQLISRFYRELAQPGVSRAGALRQAQLVLVQSDRFRHPSFWAPFLMINNWL